MLIQFLNAQFFNAQQKSRDAIFTGVVKEIIKEETVKENNDKPGNREISK